MGGFTLTRPFRTGKAGCSVLARPAIPGPVADGANDAGNLPWEGAMDTPSVIVSATVPHPHVALLVVLVLQSQS